MATKKKTVTHTPKKRKSSLTKSAKSAKKKRKSHPKKKNMLSEMVTPERAQQSGKAVLSGAVGGAVVHVIEKVIPATWGIGARLLTIGLASFATATVFNMPNMSAGMAGAGGYIAVDKKLLADDADDSDDDDDMEEAEFTDADVLEEMPQFLSQDGGVLMEDANGNLVALSERGQIQYYAPYNRQY